jgi:competence protein ComEA
MDGIAFKIKSIFGDLIANKQALIKILSIAVILALALILKIHNSGENDISVEAASESTEVAQTEEESEANEIFIDIGGAVEKPGVYKVTTGTRLYEVVELAGGLRTDADTNSVNQAAFVEDGAKIIIPQASDSQNDESDYNVEIVVPSSGIGTVNINTASKEELITLSGIGDVMADRIIEYRSNNRFSKKEDIMSVKGIGNAIFEKIKDQISI